MDEQIRRVTVGEAYFVGGYVRDRLLGRPVLDIDVACPHPRDAAQALRREVGGGLFALSERHRAWRVMVDGRSVDFALLRGGIRSDLLLRDFTANAIAVPLQGGSAIDPAGGIPDVEQGLLRAVREQVFKDDPLRLLRAARLEEELPLVLEPGTERLIRQHADLVTQAAGERILAELMRLSASGMRRLDELQLLAPLGGSLERLERGGTDLSGSLLLVSVFGPALRRLPISNELARFAGVLLTTSPPADGTARSIYRFRRATEPYALEALAYLGEDRFVDAVRAARAAEPSQPLLRGDELSVPPGPEVGRLLERIAEEWAAGTISSREEALALVRKERRGRS